MSVLRSFGDLHAASLPPGPALSRQRTGRDGAGALVSALGHGDASLLSRLGRSC